jgi:hypothetical protein
VQAARVVEEEEKRAFIAKQFNFYQQKQQVYGMSLSLSRTSSLVCHAFFCIVEKKMMLH